MRVVRGESGQGAEGSAGTGRAAAVDGQSSDRQWTLLRRVQRLQFARPATVAGTEEKSKANVCVRGRDGKRNGST